MSIPERLSRIVRHKISEMKDRFDQMDEEALADPAEMERLRRAESRLEAKRELEEAMTQPAPNPSPSAQSKNSTSKVDLPDRPLAPTTRRTPQQIVESAGSRSDSSYANSQTNASVMQQGQDPMDYHYRMLGLEPGCGFSDVQNAYNGLAARTDPSRFPAGSQEAGELEDIRQRLEISYRALRDALDSTAHRFGLLEFDADPASKPKG